MKLTAVYPQTELGGDPAAVGAFATTAEELGFDALVVYDHVLGAAHADRDPPLWGPYTEVHPFHDPFVMFGYVAAITSRIELATAVLVAPQRQTALVAQQAADVDLLSGGRLRLGVGTGWNYVEYEALGQEFASRGARLSEQVELLRRLWTEPLVSFEGRFDRVDRACIAPRPRRQIPIWFGGFGEPAFRRAARLGDGFSFAGDLDRTVRALERVRALLDEHGRKGAAEAGEFGLEMIALRETTVDAVVAAHRRWAAVGGTHFAVVTMGRGDATLDGHLGFLRDCRAALG